MLDDILDFAVISLVDNGRLSFWMPTANDQDLEISIPRHPCLEITSVCTQSFNRCEFWERRFLLILMFNRVTKANHISKNSGCWGHWERSTGWENEGAWSQCRRSQPFPEGLFRWLQPSPEVKMLPQWIYCLAEAASNIQTTDRAESPLNHKVLSSRIDCLTISRWEICYQQRRRTLFVHFDLALMSLLGFGAVMPR